ncbi:MAG TPA: gluconeogenesis factor YvcK family protein [Candidatus Nanopelagicales bacterium]|nr:gluconeogenesis factor YvcK family protein [Candidatus Nanopelagicales bacterium]
MTPRPHIVTIGGGTGHYTLLTGLRDLDARITAIVTMMDSGGSSGRLRDEYGLLPPGDFTRCLAALSSHPEALKELFGHRFRGGSLGGHTLRNLIFTAVQEITGSVPLTVERLHDIFAVQNRVLPVTIDRVDLVMHLENDRVIRGEASIDTLADILDAPVLSVYLDPEAQAYPPALTALAEADLIVIGPGDLFTSLVPNLLVGGVREAIEQSRARVLYVCNLMTKPNETPGYTVEDFVGTMAMYLGEARLDAVLYNAIWSSARLDEYESAGSRPVAVGAPDALRPGLLVPGDLISEGRLVRHDPRKLTAAIDGLARARGWW